MSSPPMAAAEIALAVADGMHRRGIATLLLEHLVSLARVRVVKGLTAEVLPDNHAVLRVLGDAGLAVRRRFGGGVVELSMPIPRNAALGEASAYLDAVADREKHADVTSFEPLLTPRSTAVVGVGHRSGSIGRTILPQYPRRRFRRKPIRGQPARRGHRGHPLRPVGRDVEHRVVQRDDQQRDAQHGQCRSQRAADGRPSPGCAAEMS